ncbi:hypothetical protein [Rhodoplanes roseus]|uniref:hypothetical protein n=1 Tax=Rhodoplanes roseus TaxID=29409 RepID=UPI0011B44811|nr:hypothetical protein [Rhodoplanes roseus]
MLKLLGKHDAGSTFDQDVISILSAALDDAWKTVQISGAFAGDGDEERARDTLAKQIIEMAKQGERDQRRLSDAAVVHLAQERATGSERYSARNG